MTAATWPLSRHNGMKTEEGVLTDISAQAESLSSDSANELRANTTRGALISVASQAVNFVLRTGSMVVLARLVTPKDFGIVAMATAATGLLALFKDAGLGMAMVQRTVITEAQSSGLFWVNLGVGTGLAALCALLAPLFVSFYSTPSLFWITVALGLSFFFNGAAAQHSAILQRSMRFGAMAVIDIAALLVSILLGIGMALAGRGYWALVVMSVSQTAIYAVGCWLAAGWVPGLPRQNSGIRSMIMFGGTVTLSNVLNYIACNTDKILLGRFWGAEALGIYGRAYTLSSVANANLYSAIGSVAFPALSRLQNDPVRFRSYFLKGYSIFLALVLPITVWCAIFADHIILVMLGPKWHEAATILLLLSPTIMAFGLINPFIWVMLAAGRALQCVKIALTITPLVVLGYSIGLHWGATGVAAGFSIAMSIAAVPMISQAKRGTLITAGDILKAVRAPVCAIAASAAVVLMSRRVLNGLQPVLFQLILETSILFGVHLIVLLFVLHQKPVYVGLLRQTRIWPFSKTPAEAASTYLEETRV